ncbi:MULTISPECIES: response regulator [Streptomyces]|uniref:Response regulator transcription factor n=2 Tax=Streptomyces rimosus subsp. rimosus TaxID=132474 RepID=A0A8A1USB5_STRR1|nr:MULTISPECIES: response regulator transcription factor [Streptomyces]KOG73910.1 LuxR family transcriptional regulator [Kitasatospora aureofaciens]MYT48566.1 response regulator [Streptomyces sp. SID5471]KEF04218.1 LuxR family transcriptional regulator [Streptomyces rimosus]KEF21723.1 LuxR family transcriptional regulator [Streptomyces rimosus]KOT37439.1 LuxR family transcriptional regulator [Streptomyces sp. NRRL WC-3701]
MIRVLVADDQVLIRAGVAALLRAAPDVEVVAEASDGEEAVRLAAEHRPDVILMDIRMPGVSGITATERILRGAAEAGEPAPRVVVLTTFDLDEYVYAALRAGASGFLLKDTPPQRLLSALATVAGGDMLFAPSVTRRLVEAYARQRDEPGREAADGPETLQALTARELEVLRHTAKGLSNPEIAARLVISEATVKTHLNRTMAKLGLCSRAQAVVLAYETGLVTPGAR